MQEISLHILDLAQNSVTAGATCIAITVLEETRANTLSVEIRDNGRGMSPQTLSRVTDPFYTTRTTRRVGLGVPLFKMAAQMTGGSFSVQSKEGEGTTVRGIFVRDHIDRMPLGDMNGTVTSLIYCNPAIDFVYTRGFDGKTFVLDTRKMRQVLGDVPLNNGEVTAFIREFICDGEKELMG